MEGKSIDKIIKSNPDESPTETITKEIEKATGKKIGCSGKYYGFEYEHYSTDVDSYL